METAEQAAPKVSAAVEFLEKHLAMAKTGDIQSVMIGYVQKDGGAAVQTTAMSPVMLNHLHMLLERRVAREYDLAMAKTSAARSPTGAMRANSPKTAPLPRKVRRQIEAAQKKAADRLAKQRAASNGAVLRRSTTTG